MQQKLDGPLDAARFFMARDGRYAENAGAIFGRCLDGANPRNRAILGQMDDVYAENAGAIFGRCLDGATTKNEAIADRVVGVMPKIHEHFSAMPSWLHE